MTGTLDMAGITFEEYLLLREIRAGRQSLSDSLVQKGITTRETACEVLNALVSPSSQGICPEILEDIEKRRENLWANRFKNEI